MVATAGHLIGGEQHPMTLHKSKWKSPELAMALTVVVELDDAQPVGGREVDHHAAAMTPTTKALLLRGLKCRQRRLITKHIASSHAPASKS
ncbi:hypothetical protein ON010_g12845 [Phytophthora cinnamomi]|nr:hypothetical protein ON010_g12845 [Phytophthora cinnamomi]